MASRSSSSRPSRLATSRRRRGREIVVEQRAAAEITHFGGVATAPERTAVFNPAFDVTPSELVTAVVTENGILGPSPRREYPVAQRSPTRPQLVLPGLDAGHRGQHLGARSGRTQ